MSTNTLLRGTNTTVMTTELNSLANNTYVASSVAGASGLITNPNAGYILVEVELVVTFGTNPTANTGVDVWFLRETDGTNYEDGFSGSAAPVRAPDLVLPVSAVTTAQRKIGVALLPPGNFYASVKNDGTGQAFAASGNTLKIRPLTPQAV